MEYFTNWSLYTPYVRAVEAHLPNIVETLTFLFISFIFHMVVMGMTRFVCENIIFTGVYNKLTSDEKMDFDSRVTSSLHAIISAASCIYIFTTYPQAINDLATVWKPEMLYICAYSGGYLLADLTVVLQQNDPMMVIHHVMGISGLLSAAGVGIFGPTIIFFFGTELTTPFINNRIFLSHFGFRDSFLFILNGLAITIGWFIVRICPIPIYTKLFYDQWDVIKKQRKFLVAQVLLFSFLVSILNLVWFYKILKGLIGVLCSKKDKGEKTTEKVEKKKME